MNKKNIIIGVVLGIIIIVIITILCILNFKTEKNYIKANETSYGDYIKPKEINDLDSFYNSKVIDEYTDIRNLPEKYSIDQAIADHCFTIGAMVHNDNLYYEFMEKYNNKESAFIRVAQTTVEGDVCLDDLLYNAYNNKVHLVIDNSRDNFSSQEDRAITLKSYEKTGVWNYQNVMYWVVYNGELPDGNQAEYTINSDELYIIAVIN